MGKLDINFEKKNTHSSYPKKRKKNEFWAGYLALSIQEYPLPSNDINKNKNFIATDEFIRRKNSKLAGPLIFGISSLIFVIRSVLIFFSDFEWTIYESITFILSLSVMILSAAYYLTVPEKQIILDRKNGLVSFPAFSYGKPYTMKIINIRVGYGGGASGSPNRDKFIIIKPNKLENGYTPSLGGNYNQELSFILWYTDKNRPLPLGDAFDDYRKKDYKRRKEDGFPPPLFRTYVPTDEFKDKWQEEREKHWKDIISTNQNGDITHQLWQSGENIALHGEWKEVVPQ
ncbi:hypothetical protein Celal_1688 [Cellulophaga algicola DSM 14237]|uniref:Uncharacterized protein n=1 Tax=Cellulophaga algicola (strain DSM 14237 / IC166 / ACAM 630) TaxID=688270 RepID=E6XBY8_CELAD|nr:hypothetical protein [Cellulophaga algicola]ADV48990.1 hypothetical protein Celal_1688 [Cellulophaga algicola DSM 14237]